MVWASLDSSIDAVEEAGRVLPNLESIVPSSPSLSAIYQSAFPIPFDERAISLLIYPNERLRKKEREKRPKLWRT